MSTKYRNYTSWFLDPGENKATDIVRSYQLACTLGNFDYSTISALSAQSCVLTGLNQLYAYCWSSKKFREVLPYSYVYSKNDKAKVLEWIKTQDPNATLLIRSGYDYVSPDTIVTKYLQSHFKSYDPDTELVTEELTVVDPSTGEIISTKTNYWYYAELAGSTIYLCSEPVGDEEDISDHPNAQVKEVVMDDSIHSLIGSTTYTATYQDTSGNYHDITVPYEDLDLTPKSYVRKKRKNGYLPIFVARVNSTNVYKIYKDKDEYTKEELKDIAVPATEDILDSKLGLDWEQICYMLNNEENKKKGVEVNKDMEINGDMKSITVQWEVNPYWGCKKSDGYDFEKAYGKECISVYWFRFFEYMRHKYGSGAHEEDIEESTYHKKFGWHGIKKETKAPDSDAAKNCHVGHYYSKAWGRKGNPNLAFGYKLDSKHVVEYSTVGEFYYRAYNNGHCEDGEGDKDFGIPLNLFVLRKCGSQRASLIAQYSMDAWYLYRKKVKKHHGFFHWVVATIVLSLIGLGFMIPAYTISPSIRDWMDEHIVMPVMVKIIQPVLNIVIAVCGFVAYVFPPVSWIAALIAAIALAIKILCAMDVALYYGGSWGDAFKNGLSAAGEGITAFAAGYAAGYAGVAAGAAVGTAGGAVVGAGTSAAEFSIGGAASTMVASGTSAFIMGTTVGGNLLNLTGNLTNNKRLSQAGTLLTQVGSITGSAYSIAANVGSSYSVFSNALGKSSSGLLGSLSSAFDNPIISGGIGLGIQLANTDFIDMIKEGNPAAIAQAILMIGSYAVNIYNYQSTPKIPNTEPSYITRTRGNVEDTIFNDEFTKTSKITLSDIFTSPETIMKVSNSTISIFQQYYIDKYQKAMENLAEKYQYLYKDHMNTMLKYLADSKLAMTQFSYEQSILCNSEPSVAIEMNNLNNCHDMFTITDMYNSQILYPNVIYDANAGTFWKYQLPFDMPNITVSLARSISLIDIYNINPYNGSYLGSIQQKKEM